MIAAEISLKHSPRVGTTAIIVLVALIAIVLNRWFVADLDYWRRWSLRRSELGAQGRWKELDQHFQAGARCRCRRPLLWLFQRMVVPGLFEAQYALHISNLGEYDRALMWADRAVRKSALHKSILEKALIARALILGRMGRYEEAKAIATRVRSFSSSRGSADTGEGVVEMNLGHLEAALALGQRAMNSDVPNDTARTLVSSVLLLQGRFQEALKTLIFEPTDVFAFFTAEGLKKVTCDELGKRLVLQMDEQVKGVFRPGRDLAIAEVCLEAGDAENLHRALDRAERELKSNPAIKHIYHRLRACSCALQADAVGTEDNLNRGRRLADEIPSRSAKYQTRHVAGRAYLSFKRNEAALAELRAAAQLALHPLEKHSTNYWLARAAEASGDAEESARLLRLVTSDGINTWMSADARARLSSSRQEQGPTSGR